MPLLVTYLASLFALLSPPPALPFPFSITLPLLSRLGLSQLSLYRLLCSSFPFRIFFNPNFLLLFSISSPFPRSHGLIFISFLSSLFKFSRLCSVVFCFILPLPFLLHHLLFLIFCYDFLLLLLLPRSLYFTSYPLVLLVKGYLGGARTRRKRHPVPHDTHTHVAPKCWRLVAASSKRT